MLAAKLRPTEIRASVPVGKDAGAIAAMAAALAVAVAA